MQKIKILGNSIKITTDLKVDEIKKLQKFAPDALVLVKELPDNTTEEYFRVAYKEGKDSISKYGITFPASTNAGRATITGLIPSDIADKKAFVNEHFGIIIRNLMEVEKQARKALTTVAKDAEAIEALIEVVDDEE